VDGSEKYRSFYAKLICAAAKLDDSLIEEAFRSVKREPFAGPGPWWLNLDGHGYVQTPDDDPAFLYQDLLLALDRERGINIGQPSAHAYWLAACNIKKAETVVQVGAGSGYYTAILAHLVGADGRVYAYEIDEQLSARARENLRELHQVELRVQSGVASDLPQADLIYVCAGAAQPSRRWLNAVRPRRAHLVPIGATGSLRRHVASYVCGPSCYVASEVCLSCRIYRLRRSSRRGSRPSFDGGIFQGLEWRAFAPARRITRSQLLVCW
jgi:protein-L-isoaspartate(D-aspartate) O-methyltransferase